MKDCKIREKAERWDCVPIEQLPQNNYNLIGNRIQIQSLTPARERDTHRGKS